MKKAIKSWLLMFLQIMNFKYVFTVKIQDAPKNIDGVDYCCFLPIEPYMKYKLFKKLKNNPAWCFDVELTRNGYLNFRLTQKFLLLNLKYILKNKKLELNQPYRILELMC